MSLEGNPRRTRMVCVLSTAEPGGAELSLVAQLVHRPPEVQPFAVVMGGGPLIASLRAAGAGVFVLPLTSSKPSALARFGFSLARLLRSLDPDLVYAVGNKAVVTVLPVTKLLAIPCLWNKVDLVMPAWQARVAARLAQGVISHGYAAGESIPRSRLRVVYPPVRLDDGFIVSEPRPPATLTCVGRLEPTKGQHHLIAAADRLKGRFPDVRVLLAGASTRHAADYGARLRALADRLGVPLDLVGYVHDVEDVLVRTTVYVQPSFRSSVGRGDEGLGIALAEASWAGLPVVASNTGGIPEVVRDGVTGTLVPALDTEALAAAIASYLDAPGVARAAGRAGAAFARSRFRPTQVSADLFEAVASFI